MKRLVFCLIAIMIAVSTWSQQEGDPITIVKKQYYQNDEKLSRDQLYTALSNNPASAKEFQEWRKKEKIGTPFIYAGIGLVAVGAGISLAGSIKQAQALNEGNIVEGASGLGVILAGVVVEVVGIAIVLPARKKHLLPAIDNYNSSLSGTGYRPVNLELMVCETGVGMRLRF